MKITKLKDGNKTKIFTKKELIEKLNFTDQEAKVVMDYQKKLPILIGSNDVDARLLWEQLGQPQGEFNKWAKRKIIDKGFAENQDFFSFDKIVEREIGATIRTEYTLTMDTAKNVSMMENTDMGRLIRKYFIKMEKALKDYEQWEMIRNPEKESYKQLCTALKDNYTKRYGVEPDGREYSREADMLNILLLGYTAKDVKTILNSKDNVTREHFDIEINKALDELQILDTGLVISGIEFEKRKEIIELTCRGKYSNAKEILS
ncbi:MAG: antA/AntB antirepressor family protein [Vallitalea sp.]|jgi:phage anti-repressor protein|nr:antA/AntB antirepressor family protein [Vallitalea sp.]